jgi:hypothetical protein
MAAARRVALKMGRRFVARQSRIDLDMLLPHASQTTHFERNETQGNSGDGTLEQSFESIKMCGPLATQDRKSTLLVRGGVK